MTNLIHKMPISGLIFVIFCLILIIFVFCVLVYMIIKMIMNGKELKRSELEKMRFLEREGITANAKLEHVEGLPIAEGIMCELFSYSTKILISGSGLQFNLEKDRILDIDIKTDVQIQKQYVIDRRHPMRDKLKTIRTTYEYLVFTYSKDNEIEYIIFECDYNSKNAIHFVSEFKKTHREVPIVNL